MRTLGQVLLFIVVLGAGEAVAACGCQAANELCVEQTLVQNEHPFVKPLTPRTSVVPQVAAWVVTAIAGVMLMRRVRTAAAA